MLSSKAVFPTHGPREIGHSFGGTHGGGVKIAGQGAVGIRLEARLLLTARNTGSGFWCGTGGCAIGVVGNPIAQGVLSGSVFVQVGGPR